jgi:hypothetical protein
MPPSIVVDAAAMIASDMSVTFEFACVQIMRKLEKIPLAPNLTSLLSVYLDNTDQIEFHRSERMFSWPSDEVIVARTFIPLESIWRTRRMLVEIELFHIEKSLTGKDGVVLIEICWRFVPPARLFRPSLGHPLPRPLVRDRDTPLQPQQGHAVGEQQRGQHGRFFRG